MGLEWYHPGLDDTGIGLADYTCCLYCIGLVAPECEGEV